MDISRRNFLKLASVAGGASLLSGALSLPVMARENITNKQLTPLRHAWKKARLPKPMAVLTETGLLHAPEKIGQQSRQDFLEGRLLDVDGLQLSVSESAFLLVHSGEDRWL